MDEKTKIVSEIVELIHDHFSKVRGVLGNRLTTYNPEYHRKFIFDLVDIIEKRIVEKINMKYESEGK